jgi:hypothetical protein
LAAPMEHRIEVELGAREMMRRGLREYGIGGKRIAEQGGRLGTCGAPTVLILAGLQLAQIRGM